MLALMLLANFALCAIPSLLIIRFVPRSKARLRYGLAVALFTFLVTPSFLAGGILAVPAPFGAVLLSSIAALHPVEAFWTLRTWPIWHMISFPLTALVGAFVFMRARPNYSLKRTAAGRLR